MPTTIRDGPRLPARVPRSLSGRLQSTAIPRHASDTAEPPREGGRHPLLSGPEVRRSYLLDIGWRAIDIGVKAATIAFAVDALFHPDVPRFRGKAIRARAVGYTAALFVVPLTWRLRFRRQPYPRALDLALSVPLLLDAAGNGMGVYEHDHVDDIVHFANAAVASAVGGALAAPQVRTGWEAAFAGTGLAISGEAVWEILEFTAWKLGAGGMDLTYEDTMADIIESSLGAILGGVFTWLHHGSTTATRSVGREIPLGHVAPGGRRIAEPRPR